MYLITIIPNLNQSRFVGFNAWVYILREGGELGFLGIFIRYVVICVVHDL